MITKVQFQNFKALKNAELKLGAFNVLIGPNGSGKSTVLQGLAAMADPNSVNWSPADSTSITLDLKLQDRQNSAKLESAKQGIASISVITEPLPVDKDALVAGFYALMQNAESEIRSYLKGIKTFSFQTASMANPVAPEI